MLVNNGQALPQYLPVFPWFYKCKFIPWFSLIWESLQIRIWKRKKLILYWHLKYLLFAFAVLYLWAPRRGEQGDDSVSQRCQSLCNCNIFILGYRRNGCCISKKEVIIWLLACLFGPYHYNKKSLFDLSLLSISLFFFFLVSRENRVSNKSC